MPGDAGAASAAAGGRAAIDDAIDDEPGAGTPRTRFNRAAVSQHLGDFDAAEELFADLSAE